MSSEGRLWEIHKAGVFIPCNPWERAILVERLEKVNLARRDEGKPMVSLGEWMMELAMMAVELRDAAEEAKGGSRRGQEPVTPCPEDYQTDIVEPERRAGGQ